MSNIGGGIDEHFVNGIYHDVLWRDVFQIDAINLPRHLSSVFVSMFGQMAVIQMDDGTKPE